MAVWYKAGSTECYNVESRVGIGLRASRLDVKLAQFLLTKATRYAKNVGRLGRSSTLQQDGVFGSGTLRALIAFQQCSPRLIPDGVVSPMRGNQGGWDDAHTWTIGSMQYCYAILEAGVPKGSDIPMSMITEVAKRAPFDREIDPELGAHLLHTRTPLFLD